MHGKQSLIFEERCMSDGLANTEINETSYNIKIQEMYSSDKQRNRHQYSGEKKDDFGNENKIQVQNKPLKCTFCIGRV